MQVQQWGSDDIYKHPPPQFGHGMHKYFGFDPQYINLNHGSYGATPLPVLAAVNKIAIEIESNPDYFHRIQYQPILIDIRRRLSQMIGASLDECVLVQNASMGMNIIMRGLEWEAGDILVPFNTTYRSVSKTVKYISDIKPCPVVAQFVIEFPTTHEEIVTKFREHLRSLPDNKGKKKVAVIDSIVSNPGSVVDAAHSIGQEETNLSESQPDFWVSNCHKWLFTKRSCAVLYVPERQVVCSSIYRKIPINIIRFRNQNVVKTSIPTSHSYISPVDRVESNFVIQYEWNGTIDWAPYLSVNAALDFRSWLGGEAKINAYCHEMAIKGGKRLAEIFGTRVLDPDGELTLNMVNVELPFPGNVPFNAKIDLKFKQKMLEEQNTYSAPFYHNGSWWTRCSAQVWTEVWNIYSVSSGLSDNIAVKVEDFEKIGQAWLTVCAEVLEEIEGKKVS
ncbi:pyridoxal phosphate-dependent transferase [Collybia nuda]|uniref:Pyridoxal phosphate-dependent transferase n=1 Tax=Collybia nuda TaxID=64659 RepID=A0A9P5YDE4_9AGAR|nr:pyridoxal phosphate-dependent transferase [Collybia nuda]